MSKRTIYGLGAFTLAAAMSTTAWSAPMIAVNNQMARGNTVTIAEVEIPHDGFVVIHASKNGKPVAPQHVGYAPVKAGLDHSVKVTLNQTPEPGATYFAMLHNDSGQKGKFEFGLGHTNVDKPLMFNGKPVTKSFKIQKTEK